MGRRQSSAGEGTQLVRIGTLLVLEDVTQLSSMTKEVASLGRSLEVANQEIKLLRVKTEQILGASLDTPISKIRDHLNFIVDAEEAMDDEELHSRLGVKPSHALA